MATETTNLGLTKPAGSDASLIASINANMDIIDRDLVTILGAGDPTTATVGALGQHYRNTSSGQEFTCTVVDSETPEYTWEASGSSDMLASTYDPTNVGGDAFDMDNMAQGTTNKYVSAAELTVLQATSGANTGDQTLPTRDSLGLDTDDTVTFANLSGTNTGDETPSDDNPLMNGTAAPGTSDNYSRKDHVHPSDTTKQALVSSPTDGHIMTTDENGQGEDSGQYLPLHNFEYGGRDLSTIFADAAALHTAVAAGNFNNIRIGDYWPITLTGTFRDYGVDGGSGYTERTLSSAVFKLEVAGINLYLNYADTALTAHHLVFASRDLIPQPLQMRTADSTWYNGAATNPWLGSALYETLNNATYGVLALVAATDIGAYIFAGPNGYGMRYLAETKASGVANATGWGWADRGKLFLPSEREVWGSHIWDEQQYGAGLAVQWPIFRDSLRHVIKGLGNGGSRYNWWCLSSYGGSSTYFAFVTGTGHPNYASAADTYLSAPLCFLVA